LHAGDDLYTNVALLFSAIIVHGFSPEEFCTGTIIPIPKGSNANLTDNAISGYICWGFWSHKYSNYFLMSNLQFSFKAKHYTHLCTMTVRDLSYYYNSSNSMASCTFLDAIVAFDQVGYCKFYLLIDRGLTACLIRVLISLCTGYYQGNDVCLTSWISVNLR